MRMNNELPAVILTYINRLIAEYLIDKALNRGDAEKTFLYYQRRLRRF